jgi:putative ABC transport system substrate-binding protein
MRRRDVLGLLGSAALWPADVYAQRQTLPIVGGLAAPAQATYTHHVAAIRDGLKEVGFIEGETVALEFLWADGHYERLPEMAAALVKRDVDVIITLGGGPPIRAAKAATTTIPIVFHLGADPVELGLVASMNRPGGNVTGVTLMTNQLEPKRLELLCKMVPGARRIAVLANPFNRSNDVQIKLLEKTAEETKLALALFRASTIPELDAQFAKIAEAKIDALTILSDVFFTSNSPRIATLAQRHRIPAIAHSREFADAGGLMSYGTNLTEAYRLCGVYAGRILKGEKPSEMPVMEPTRFDFVINLKSAKLLGLTVPPLLLAIADEAVE